MNKVTIKEVANEAGVSIATVSYVINQTRTVSDETAGRVKAAIKKLKYYPNRLVHTLKGKSIFTIGMIIPNIANETFGKLAGEIQIQLFEWGYDLIVCNTSYTMELEEKALNSFMMKKVDAVIAIPSNYKCSKLGEISNANIPVVLVDRILQDVDLDTVFVDNFKGQYAITSYIIRMGHRNIGYIDRIIEQSHSNDQRNGYLTALRDNGIEPNPKYIEKANGHYYMAGAEAGQTLIQRCPEITAIACYYDPIAFGVIRGLVSLGYDVPKDVSVVGYDNMRFCEATVPALTTVDTPISEMAAETCNLLKARLNEINSEQERQPRQKVVLVPKLVIRESVKRLETTRVKQPLRDKPARDKNNIKMEGAL